MKAEVGRERRDGGWKIRRERVWEREGRGRGKVGGRQESIECSNYSLNHVLNLGCHWLCFAGVSSTEGLHRAN